MPREYPIMTFPRLPKPRFQWFSPAYPRLLGAVAVATFTACGGETDSADTTGNPSGGVSNPYTGGTGGNTVTGGSTSTGGIAGGGVSEPYTGGSAGIATGGIAGVAAGSIPETYTGGTGGNVTDRDAGGEITSGGTTAGTLPPPFEPSTGGTESDHQ